MGWVERVRAHDQEEKEKRAEPSAKIVLKQLWLRQGIGSKSLLRTNPINQ
jgi:hypothetical protein